jgi:hypothetical protein
MKSFAFTPPQIKYFSITFFCIKKKAYDTRTNAQGRKTQNSKNRSAPALTKQMQRFVFAFKDADGCCGVHCTFSKGADMQINKPCRGRSLSRGRART